MESCEIKVNNEIIPFSYFYKFKEKGEYIIEYSFNHKLAKMNLIISDYEYLSEINLNSFDSTNVTNMRSIFYKFKRFQF